MVAALIFCMPKFFESKIIETSAENTTSDNISNILEKVNVRYYHIFTSNIKDKIKYLEYRFQKIYLFYLDT